MSAIINGTFSVGDRFVGRVNQRKFTVSSVKQEVTERGTESGRGRQKVRNLVYFLDEATSKTIEVSLETARRLLLDRV